MKIYPRIPREDRKPLPLPPSLSMTVELPEYFAIVPVYDDARKVQPWEFISVPKKFCKCGKKRRGFFFSAKTGFWKCADCKRPTRRWWLSHVYYDLGINLWATHAYEGREMRRY